MKVFSVYLRSILDSITAVKAAKNSGAIDDTVSKAIKYDLVTIGEAARMIPEDVRSRYPEVPWSEVVAFRNVLVHGYLSVNMDVVWHVVNHELDILEITAERMIKELGE